MIPLVDLVKQYHLIEKEIHAKIKEVIETSSLIQGKTVSAFSKEFALRHQCAFGAGCSNGTTALTLALLALGIGKGDEVITTTHTFVATIEAIWQTGARPVLADVDPKTYLMDIEKIPSLITAKTKAIVPVHLYGQPMDMTRLMTLARTCHLKVIEDCAQAHDSSWDGQKVGSFGDAAIFSFYPGKNLGAYGDAGIVISNSQEIIEKAGKLLNHGRAQKYYHDIPGYNYRMADVQAGILQVKLRYLHGWTEKRRQHAKRYSELLKDCQGIVFPQVMESARHVYHLYVIETEQRDELAAYLEKHGISTGIHYPVPVHLQPAFNYLGYQENDFPAAENASKRILSLPMYPELEENEISYICQTIQRYLKNKLVEAYVQK